jgi:NTP pyrophosphatase (non-canonical NTP hydrolase)
MSNTDQTWGMILSLNDYQAAAMGVRLEQADDRYALDGLVGEVGELFSHLAKARRDGRKPDHDLLIKKELGDILWFVAAIAADQGYTLEHVANVNIAKLYSRKEHGTLRGSGDFR